jgi:deoxyribonuclease-4
MTRFLGAHTINNGGIHMAVKRAGNAGMTAMQLFTAIPKYYGDKISIKPERVERFKSALGVGQVCFHSGSAGTGDRSASAKRIAKAITDALKAVDSETRLLIENTAGAGATMGKTAEEIAEILSHVPKSLRPRTGYGLDTCHMYSSGYDITESKAIFKAIIDDFEEKTGEAPSFFHLNDSADPLGSNKDRHVLIGDGLIGPEPFRWLLADPRAKGIPLILETPQLNYDIADDDPSPDPYDVQMMELLTS